MEVKPSAYDQITELMAQMTGQEIAQTLLDEGYSIDEVKNAFIEHGYVASIEQFTSDVRMLHVSKHTMQAGIEAMLYVVEPRTLPSVVWRKK